MLPSLLLAASTLALAPRALHALRCAVCRDTSFMGVGPYQNELDRFRVSYNVPRPYCRLLDFVECDRDQDLCATIVTQMPADQGYWIGMGCGQRHQYPQEAGCERIAQDTRAVTYDRDASGRRRIVEDRAVQDICVCHYDYCNSAPAASLSLLTAALLLLHAPFS